MKNILNRNISMVDLKSQYKRLKPEIDRAIADVINQTSFIKGKALKDFEQELAQYLNVNHVIGVGNGTDALQIALMSLDLSPGDEVIVPAFTYVATAEVIGLLGLKPVMVDVDYNTFNLSLNNLNNVITNKTKVIVPVHLFGQTAHMDEVIGFAKKHDLYIIEDNAQALGADYLGQVEGKAGTLGHIGCTSFFPSKNLGCFGDGGAIFTNDDEMANKIRMIANHGQAKKYHHSVIGVNSRLDTIQAAILSVKLKELNDFSYRRQQIAQAYNESFAHLDGVVIPVIKKFSNHVYHQYTLKIECGKRDELSQYLKSKGIPSMVYYPIPLYKQEAFKHYFNGKSLPITEKLCKEVLSLPIHTEMKSETQSFIIDTLLEFYKS